MMNVVTLQFMFYFINIRVYKLYINVILYTQMLYIATCIFHSTF